MDILNTIGSTPLIFLKSFSGNANIFIKQESMNPGGSIKDRAALGYIRDALRTGKLKKGGTVVEATSGNLGIGLAVVCSQLGIKLILTMPSSASHERKALLAALGAELVLTPAENGMQGAQDKAEELVSLNKGAFRPNQFSNPLGPKIHYDTTGMEIFMDCYKEQINPDAFVAGVGSGATLMGVSKRLKEMDTSTFCAAVEPKESPVLSQGKAGTHNIQGIGANFVPEIFQRDLIDDIILVSTEEAMETAGKLMAKESLLCGITSGANVCAAEILSKRSEFKGKNIITIAPDTGERYLSTPLFPHI